MKSFKVDMNHPLRYRIEKWIWYTQIPLAIACYLYARALWDEISILYLVILSIWSPASTADGNEESAHARRKADELDGGES